MTVQFVGFKKKEISVTRTKLVQCGDWLHTSVTERATCGKLPTFSFTGAYAFSVHFVGFSAWVQAWSNLRSESLCYLRTDRARQRERVCVCVGVLSLFPSASNHSHRRHYLINQLTNFTWSRILLEKLRGSQIVQKFPTVFGTQRMITAYTKAHHLSLFWARSIHSMPTPIPLPEDPL